MNYGAPWWLPDGNLQTLWAALRARRCVGPPPVFRRERWTTPDSDFVDVDWLVDMAPTLVASRTALPPEGAGLAWGGPALRPDAPSIEATCPSQPHGGAGLVWGGPALQSPTCERPLLVVFHGLEGSSASHYAQAFADVARSRGWACAVPHFRGCSGELNLAPRAYHSGDFAEIDWMLRRFVSQHHGPVVAVGVSLGGNALMRWAGELGGEARQVVAAVASVCAPLDLAASGRAIGQGFNRQVYTRMFLKSMVPKALQKLAQYPGLFNREALLAARDLYAFDNIFTGPVHGFKGVDDYWARASAKPHLRQIAVPALALNALNDPFIPASSLPQPADVSPQVTLWQPEQGGHVGFPSAGFPAHVRAMPEAVASFLAAQL
jgi:predicted alpha/beta-fold hydrolase